MDRWTLTTSLLGCKGLGSLTLDARLSQPSAKVAPTADPGQGQGSDAFMHNGQEVDLDELVSSGGGVVLDMSDFFGMVSMYSMAPR